MSRVVTFAVSLLVCACLLTSTTRVGAQDAPAPALDGAGRARIVEALANALHTQYVFPAVADDIGAKLRQKLAKGRYDDLRNADAFANALTSDLQAFSHDLHLRVNASEHPLPERGADNKATPDEEAQLAQRLQSVNYGVGNSDRLPGNIAYLALRGFAPLRFARPALGAAMAKVADADALIIDLRQNSGGDPASVAFVASYLFNQRTHLNDLYWRDGDRTEQFWTSTDLPGAKFGQVKPVYLLTSKRTFSGAEELAYDLKALKRATLVGETTGGGANPGDVHRLGPYFAAFIPKGRAINPITKTNWEGVGVQADVPVPASDALLKAQQLALAALVAGQGDAAKLGVLRARQAELARQQGWSAADFAKQPIYLRGTMNNWGNSDTLCPRDARTYSVDIALNKGRHEFKVASADFETVDFGASHGQQLYVGLPNKTLSAGGDNLAYEVDVAGVYTFSLSVLHPHEPVLSVRRRGDSAQASVGCQ